MYVAYKGHDLHATALVRKVVDLFQGRNAKWIPTAGYELRRESEVLGKLWTICLKVEVLGEVDPRGRVGVRFESTITVWPPKLTPRDERRLCALGWYKTLAVKLCGRKYSGRWRKGSHGKWAMFAKELRTPADVRREAEWLEALAFDPPVPVRCSGASTLNRRR